MIDRQGANDRVLGQVGVLILVHHDVLVLGIQFATNLGVLAKQSCDVKQQVVKIDGVGGQ